MSLLPHAHRGIKFSLLNWRITLSDLRQVFIALALTSSVLSLVSAMSGAYYSLVIAETGVAVLSFFLVALPNIETRGKNVITTAGYGGFRRNDILTITQGTDDGQELRVVYAEGNTCYVKKIRS